MFQFRDFVITRWGEPAHIVRPVGLGDHRDYMIVLLDGTAQIVRADDLKFAAEVYQNGFGRASWDGIERRKAERRQGDRRARQTPVTDQSFAERRHGDRRKGDRRWLKLKTPP